MPASKAWTRWSAVVDDLEASGLTARAFARERGLNANTLGWWRWRLRQEAARRQAESPRFAELTLIERAAARPREPSRPDEPGLLLTLDTYGAHLRVDAATDLALLRDVLEALC